MNESLQPELTPTVEAVPVSPPDPLKDIMGQLVSQIHISPELEGLIAKIRLEAGDIENIYEADYQAIDLDALREDTNLSATIWGWAKTFFMERVTAGITDELDIKLSDVELGELEGLIPDIDRAAEVASEKGIAIVDDKKNIIPSRATVRSFLPAFFSTALSGIMKPKESRTVEEDKVQREASKDMLQALFSMYPAGGTVIEAPKAGVSTLIGQSDQLKFKLFLASQGLRIEKTTPRDAAFMEAVPPDVIRIVQVPDDKLPKLESGWNLSIVDRFVALHDRGKTVWQEGQLRAMVLVRQGMPVEQALSTSGIVPDEQQTYSQLRDDLQTLPVKGADEPVVETTSSTNV